jgi:hypothetical protein
MAVNMLNNSMTDKDEIHESLQDTYKRIINEHYEPNDDKMNQASLTDTRRPRLTLRHLNKLRKIQELKKLESESHAEFVRTMYAEPDEGGEPEF